MEFIYSTLTSPSSTSFSSCNLSLFFSSSPDTAPGPSSANCISVKESWPLDLDDLVDPPPDPFDFLWERLGMLGSSCEGDSEPRFDGCRCRLACLLLPDESRAEESVKFSRERWRLECFDPSELRLVGEPIGEPLLPDERWRLDLGIPFFTTGSWAPRPALVNSIRSNIPIVDECVQTQAFKLSRAILFPKKLG